METIRITSHFGETLTYYLGQIAGVDTTEDHWWLSEDKKACLRMIDDM